MVPSLLENRTCNSTVTIGLDERYAGISNQLLGLQRAWCAARDAGMCSVYSAPLGYHPHPTSDVHRGQHEPKLLEPIERLLTLSPWASAATRNGARVQSATRAPDLLHALHCLKRNATCYLCSGFTKINRCLESNSQPGGPEEGKPFVFMPNAFNAQPKQCAAHLLVDVTGVTRRVERYARKLMTRLGLLGHEYVAVQHRVGADLRQTDTFGQISLRMRNGIACYGHRTIEAALGRAFFGPNGTTHHRIHVVNGVAAEVNNGNGRYSSRDDGPPLPSFPHSARSFPRFTMTNLVGGRTSAAHDNSSSPALRLVAESLIASRARFVLLNPVSSIQHLIRRFRVLEGRPIATSHMRTVHYREITDSCSCESADMKNHYLARKAKRFCSNPEEFVWPRAELWANSSQRWANVSQKNRERAFGYALINLLSQYEVAVKTLQPLFATLLSAIFLREPASSRRIVSLLLLLVGVAIATTTELSFSTVGFVCTVASSFAQALQAVLSKSLLVHNRIGERDLFACTAVCTTVMLLPLWLFTEAPSLIAGEQPTLRGSGAATLLLLNAGVYFFAQSLSFSVLCTVKSPVSAAVVSTFKRVVVIAVAVVWFQTPITLPHAGGVGLAVLGVTLFQETHKTAESATPHVYMPVSLAASPRLAGNPRKGHRGHRSPFADSPLEHAV